VWKDKTKFLRKSFWLGSNPIQNNIMYRTSRQRYDDINTAQYYAESAKNKVDIIKMVMMARYSYAKNTQPFKRSIEILQNLVYTTRIEFKDKEGNVLENNPIEDLFETQSISFIHQGFRDFMHSVVEKLCCIDGILYLLVELNGSNIININVIPSDYIMPFMQNPASKMITRYQINNILNLRNAIFQLNAEGYYESTNTESEYRLYTTDIVFEDNIDGIQMNLTKSPIPAIAQQIVMYDSAVQRAISINQNGSSGTAIMIGTSITDPEGKKELQEEFEEKIKGAHNTGKTVVLVTTKGMKDDGTDFHSTPIGSKASDFNIANDKENAENDIFGNFGLTPSYAKQEARYVGNQAESLRQIYESKVFPDTLRIYHYLKKWLFPLLGYDVNEYFCSVNTSKIDVFVEKQVQFVKETADILSVDERREIIHYAPMEAEEDDAKEDKNEPEDDTEEEDDMEEEIGRAHV